jgi:hypothetical protein
MLTAYFDDSGTHPNSDVVIWAGLFGNQYQWESFSEDWAKKLQAPSPGKPPLRRFHMVDCQNGTSEFLGWSRTATDFLVHELGDILLKNGIWGYGCAVSRKDWDQLITGNMRVVQGDAEGQCVRNVYVRSLRWAQRHTSDHHIAYVFDERKHRTEENKRIFDYIQSLYGDESISPALVSLTFALSVKSLPLQAADMFAWEIYQHALYAVSENDNPWRFGRKQLKRLLDGKRLSISIARRAEIQKMATMLKVDPEMAVAFAEYMS